MHAPPKGTEISLTPIERPLPKRNTVATRSSGGRHTAAGPRSRSRHEPATLRRADRQFRPSGSLSGGAARRWVGHGSVDVSVGSTERTARPSARALAASTCFRPRWYHRTGCRSTSPAKITFPPRPSLGQRLGAHCPAGAASARLRPFRTADRLSRFPAGNTRRSRWQIGAPPDFPREIVEGQIGRSVRIAATEPLLPWTLVAHCQIDERRVSRCDDDVVLTGQRRRKHLEVC